MEPNPRPWRSPCYDHALEPTLNHNIISNEKSTDNQYNRNGHPQPQIIMSFLAEFREGIATCSLLGTLLFCIPLDGLRLEVYELRGSGFRGLGISLRRAVNLCAHGAIPNQRICLLVAACPAPSEPKNHQNWVFYIFPTRCKISRATTRIISCEGLRLRPQFSPQDHLLAFDSQVMWRTRRKQSSLHKPQPRPQGP